MTVLALVPVPLVELLGFLVALACAVGGAVAILEVDMLHLTPGRRPGGWLDRERDIAANLGWPWQRWVLVRVALVVAGVALGAVSRIWLLVLVGGVLGVVGFRFALAGRAAARRLRMERAFLDQLRNLRDRMAISNQSLDTALAEIGSNPGPELQYVLAPLTSGGAVLDNVVAMGERARSPIVEYACAVLLWARSRSLDNLILAIDELLLPVGHAQLAIEEEATVTLSQQRAVTFAMSFLMLAMFAIVVRIDSFREYYQSLAGNLVLLAVVLVFCGLVAALGLIVRVRGWTRWDLRRLAAEQERLGG